MYVHVFLVFSGSTWVVPGKSLFLVRGVDYFSILIYLWTCGR